MLIDKKGKDTVNVRFVDKRTNESWRVVSVYCRPSKAKDVMIGKIKLVLVGSRRKRTFIANDANARSRMCFSEEIDVRGRSMDKMLVASEVCVLKEYISCSVVVLINMYLYYILKYLFIIIVLIQN